MLEAGTLPQHPRFEQSLASIAVVQAVLAQPNGVGAPPDPSFGQPVLETGSNAVRQGWVEGRRGTAPDQLVQRSLLRRRQLHRRMVRRATDTPGAHRRSGPLSGG